MDLASDMDLETSNDWNPIGINGISKDMTVPERKALLESLMYSIPRHELSEVYENLREYLRRDIVSALPKEVSLLILFRLPVATILDCSLVSKSWSELVNSQALWHKLCIARNIKANSETTWKDVHNEEEWQSTASLRASSRRAVGISDGGSDEDEGVGSSFEGFAGVRQTVVERPDGISSAAGGVLSSSPLASRIHDAILGKSPELPVWQRTAQTQSPATDSRAQKQLLPYLSTPTPKPQANFKHLYLTQRIINGRYHQGLSRPQILDSRSSLRADGLPGHKEGIYCLSLYNHHLSISPPSDTETANGSMPTAKCIDGRSWVLSGSRDKTIRLWDATTARVVKIYSSEYCRPSSAGNESSSKDQPIIGHTGSVLTLFALASESGAGGRMISGGSDGRLVVWDLETGRIDGTIQACQKGESILCVRFDQTRIVCCSKDRSIRTFDAVTFAPLLVIGGPDTNSERDLTGNMQEMDQAVHKAAVNAVALTNCYIISASGDRTLRIWSADTGDLLLRIEAHSRGIASLDVDLRTSTAITGSSDWGIRSFDLAKLGFDLQSNQPPSTSAVRSAINSEDTGLEFSIRRRGASGSVPSFEDLPANSGNGGNDSTTVDNLPEQRSHSDLVRALWLGDNVVVSGSYDFTIKIWDRFSGVLLHDLPRVHDGRIFCVVGDRTKVVSSGIDQKIVLWDFASDLRTCFIGQ